MKDIEAKAVDAFLANVKPRPTVEPSAKYLAYLKWKTENVKCERSSLFPKWETIPVTAMGS